jgi:hypothetical protein
LVERRRDPLSSDSCHPDHSRKPIAKRNAPCSIFRRQTHRENHNMRKELALLTSVAALFTFIAFSAQAMPAAPLKGASNSDQVIHVAEGCGRGWHRGPHGHCRRN